MDGATLLAAMEYSGYPAPLTPERYGELAGPCEAALEQAGCTTVRRAAMFLAQIGAESGSLRWTEELADGSAYEGRADLGNYQPGDGHRFKGRSFIQVTGRAHYSNLSIWAHAKGYVDSPTFFIDNPTALADDRYAFIGPVWYWTVVRPHLNDLADQGDISAATYAVNGGYNNLAGRSARWRKCLTLGADIVPGAGTDSATQHRIDSKAGRMFQIIRNQDTKVWYAYAPGYWHRFTSPDEVAWVSSSQLCVNRPAVKALLKAPTRAALDAFSFGNTHVVQLKRFALGG